MSDKLTPQTIKEAIESDINDKYRQIDNINVQIEAKRKEIEELEINADILMTNITSLKYHSTNIEQSLKQEAELEESDRILDH